MNLNALLGLAQLYIGDIFQATQMENPIDNPIDAAVRLALTQPTGR
jgi:hypothetical protein